MIYLLPIGAFPATAPVAQLAEIVHAFFMLEVKTLRGKPLDASVTGVAATHH